MATVEHAPSPSIILAVIHQIDQNLVDKLMEVAKEARVQFLTSAKEKIKKDHAAKRKSKRKQKTHPSEHPSEPTSEPTTPRRTPSRTDMASFLDGEEINIDELARELEAELSKSVSPKKKRSREKMEDGEQEEKKKRGVSTCSKCGELGHTSRSKNCRLFEQKVKSPKKKKKVKESQLDEIANKITKLREGLNQIDSKRESSPKRLRNLSFGIADVEALLSEQTCKKKK